MSLYSRTVQEAIKRGEAEVHGPTDHGHLRMTVIVYGDTAWRFTQRKGVAR